MTKIEITNPDPAFPCVLATTDESTFLLIDRNDKDKNSFRLFFFPLWENCCWMFFNAGREVDLVFESKNIMVDWWIFFLFIWPAECL